jgi:drug/metabolite transporter (DMT)-like permease
MILIILLYALCASTFTICKALLAYAKPFFFIAVRMLIAGGILVGYSSWKEGSLNIKKKDYWLFLQIIIFHIYLAYVLDLWSLQYMSSSKSSFLYNLSPFIAALFSYFFFAERMTARKWLGLTIGFAGFLPEILFKSSFEFSNFWPSYAEIVLFGAVTSGVYGWITMRKLVKDESYSPLMVNGVGMVGGGFLALVTSYIVEGWSASPVFALWPFIQLTTLIIIVGNILFYNFYGYLLTKYTATFLSFAGFTTPFFAALFGWFFLGEVVNWTFFVSLVFVSCGLYIFHLEELKQGYSV